MAEYPTIWSLKQKMRETLNFPLIYHKQWLPQEDILALPEVCAFVSHCGWGSTTEAVMNETPLICVPGFGDQIYNAELVHAKELGVQIYSPPLLTPKEEFSPKLSSETIAKAIREVMENDKYRKNMAHTR
jgi:UDP:flavonoid glycosyltransferase YjiC (YdhE family)